MSPRFLLLCTLVVLASMIAIVQADTYMHMHRGSNNRLNEQGQERNNGARLFDSQNNNRGGYNAGSVQRPYYIEGSVLPIEWTQQHSCGDPNGNFCEIILQYTCGDRWTRDGTTTNTIPTDPTQCTDAQDGDCDKMLQYGRHESQASYQSCRYRSRNRGLFLANQRMQNPGTSARFTRQNNDGGRSGLECPEERDYYPYWHPTIWRDIAVVTNNKNRCLAFQQESQNVKARYYCQWDASVDYVATKIAQNQEGFVPITQGECESSKFQGKWVRVEPWNIDPPECVQNGFTRDNHLGNSLSADPKADTNGSPNYYNWTLPSVDLDANCVFRLRYNISTGEFKYQGFASDYDVATSIDNNQNMVPLDPTKPDNNARFPSEFPIWAQYGMTRDETNGSFTAKVQNDDPNNDDAGTDGRLGGIRRSLPPSRDYTLRNNPQPDMFGKLLKGNQSSDPLYFNQPMIRTRLAVNTAQYGRTFQDRSHVFEIRKRPAELQGVKIWNLSVRGKRGNIVQVYPGVEYDFIPDRLFVDQGDMVHVQWTGTIPSDGEGGGNTANNGDRNNIVMLRPRNYVESGESLNPVVHYGKYGNNYPAYINVTNDQPGFLGWDFIRLRMLALYGLNSSHFDLGPVQVATPGEYRYVCTRNNAFSNRSQKGLIVVRPNPAWASQPEDVRNKAFPAPVSMTGETTSPSGRAKLVQTYWDGTMMVPGGVTVDDGPSGHDGDWYVVNPPVMALGVMQNDDGDGVQLELSRPMEGNFFYKGKMMWKLTPDGDAVEIQPSSSSYSAKNKVMIQNGGYYQSTSVPNSAMIAGITLGCIGIAAIFCFLYWKVRIQPMGGFKAWRDGPKPRTSDASAPLSSAPSSAASDAPVVSTQV